ncbi:hypothetical protein P154DRAFT_350001 [Amniculicola lignicola CBS 123094]|uniref:DUF7730 domain-containing protein n=1 Tax=Amniculicola lignicola CBS 123094 TaxID=1392246 RepID=A0A6A5W4X6_9PLEO|nr:hypothetical protein P154DRAFT_350001 [Amniculicola lignicola CBS 123094]
MAPAQSSLFYRAHGQSPTKTRGFMGLPGELRNQIYAYYFQEALRVEIMAKGTKIERPAPKTVKLSATPVFEHREKAREEKPHTLRISRRLGRYHHVDGLRTDWTQSLCPLILVCKAIHREVLPFLYQKTTFVFDAPSRLNEFLRVTPKKSLLNLTKLELHYTTYNHPRMSEHQPWRDKHRESWMRVCRTVIKRLKNLEDLRLCMYVMDSPLKFDLEQIWLLPLLQFRRLCRPRKPMIPSKSAPESAPPVKEVDSDSPRPKLQNVSVDFRTYWSHAGVFPDNPILAEASKNLHSLFGEAIEGAILGQSAEQAMKGFVEVWDDDEFIWRHHLQFGETGW